MEEKRNDESKSSYHRFFQSISEELNDKNIFQVSKGEKDELQLKRIEKNVQDMEEKCN